MEGDVLLIDRNRVDEITEIGFVDGAPWMDALALAYGPSEAYIRLRGQDDRDKSLGRLAPDQVLEDVLETLATALVDRYPYETKPVVRMLRGHQARKWMRGLISKCDEFCATAKREPPSDGASPVGRVKIEMTEGFTASEMN